MMTNVTTNNIVLQFNDNIVTTLSKQSFLYQNSGLFNSLPDEDTPVDILCGHNVFFDSTINAYYFDIYNDLFFMFNLQTSKFIDLCLILDYLLYKQEYNKEFSKKFIMYIINNNIKIKTQCFMYSEIQSINNNFDGLDINIQLKICDVAFYEMFYLDYIEETINHLIRVNYNESIKT